MTAPLFGRANPMSSAPDISFKYIATVYGSLASLPSTLFQNCLPGVASRPQRLSDATTSVAVISFPLWNFTPRRSRNRYVRPLSVTVCVSTSSGMALYWRSYVNRVSYTCQVICCTITAVVVCRSSVGGSPIIATRSRPPARGCSLGWAEAGVSRARTSASERRVMFMRTPCAARPGRQRANSTPRRLLDDLPDGRHDVVGGRHDERLQR